jgi:hypothetical protein
MKSGYRLYQQITFRTNAGQRQQIEFAAWAMGVSVAEYCRVVATESAKLISQKIKEEGAEFIPAPDLPQIPEETDLQRVVKEFNRKLANRSWNVGG